jgi:hypothetical protein
MQAGKHPTLRSDLQSVSDSISSTSLLVTMILARNKLKSNNLARGRKDSVSLLCNRLALNYRRNLNKMYRLKLVQTYKILRMFRLVSFQYLMKMKFWGAFQDISRKVRIILSSLPMKMKIKILKKHQVFLMLLI